MTKILFAALLVCCACWRPGFAQGQAARPVPRQFDSFGEIQWSDLMARLDNFAVELQNEPESGGLVVAYASKHKFPGWPLRRAHSSIDYLTGTRGLDASRLSAANGGLRDAVGFELWVVPPGAETPVRHSDASLLMSGEKSALLFDRFAVAESEGEGNSAYGLEPHPGSAGVYEYFAEVLRADPALRGYVVGYAARRGPPGAGRRVASLAKLTMAKSYAVDVGRVVAAGGGRRDYKTIELWLVPPGAELPKPTPTARTSTRRKTRRR